MAPSLDLIGDTNWSIVPKVEWWLGVKRRGERRMALTGRLALASSVICCAVVAVFIAFALLQFNQIRAELERERIAILAERVAAPFEAATRIGLPLSSVRNADALLERARQLDRSIEAIFVLSPQGEMLRSVGAPAEETTEPRFMTGAVPAAGKYSFIETTRGYHFGRSLFDATGRPAGGIAIHFSGQESRLASWAMAGQLIVSGLLFALGMVPVIWASLRLVLRRRTAAFAEFAHEIQVFETQGWRGQAPANVASKNATTPLRALLASAEMQYRRGIESASRDAGIKSYPSTQAPALLGTGLQTPVVLVLGTILAAAIGFFSILTINAFNSAITPDLESRTQLIGGLIRGELQRALDLGVPIQALGGLTTYLDETLQDFPEIAHISIIGSGGDIIAQTERAVASTRLDGAATLSGLGIATMVTDLPVLVGSEFAGNIRIEGNPRFFQTRLRDVLLDVAVLALAVMLVGLEITLAMLAATVWKPHARIMALLAEQSHGRFDHLVPEAGPPEWRRLARRLNDRVIDLGARFVVSDSGRRRNAAPARQLRLSHSSDIRLPLFLLAFGTEMTASFLPIFAAGAARPDWLPGGVAAAAPLFLYLLCVSALTPLAGTISNRIGARPLFLASVPPIILALSWMSLSHDITSVSLARGAVAAFYALASIAAQEFALRADPAGNVGRVVGTFVGLILGGTFCGSVTGAVVAGRFGYGTAILAGAVIILGAGIASYMVMRGPATDAVPRAAPATAAIAAASRLPRAFVALVLGIAMPASAVTAAFVWYYTPLSLASDGLRPADIGRVVMLYYLAAILLGPFVLPYADRKFAVALCLGGALLSGAALLSLSTGQGMWITAGTVAVVGIGHTMLRAPVYALARGLTSGAARSIVLLRLTERLGAIAGIAFAAAMMSRATAAAIPATLGLMVVTGLFYFTLTALPQIRDGVAAKEG